MTDGRETPPQRRVALPIVSAGVDHDAFHRVRVALPVLPRLLPGIPFRNDDGAPIGIEQNLARIETQTLTGIERTEGAIRVDLSGADPGHEGVPVMVGAVRARVEVDHMRRRCRFGILEQQQLDPRGLPREHGKIDAIWQDDGAQGKALTGARRLRGGIKSNCRDRWRICRAIANHRNRLFPSRGIRRRQLDYFHVRKKPMSPGIPPGYSSTSALSPKPSGFKLSRQNS